MSVEELLRTLDRKVRLAPRIVQEQDGWRLAVVGRLVVFAEDSTNRRRVERASILASALPLRGRGPSGVAARAGYGHGWRGLPVTQSRED